MIFTELLKEIKKKFGSKGAKNILCTSCKDANIGLKSRTERDSPNYIDNISVDLLKEKVASFTEVTLDFKVDMSAFF